MNAHDAATADEYLQHRHYSSATGSTTHAAVPTSISIKPVSSSCRLEVTNRRFKDASSVVFWRDSGDPTKTCGRKGLPSRSAVRPLILESVHMFVKNQIKSLLTSKIKIWTSQSHGQRRSNPYSQVTQISQNRSINLKNPLSREYSNFTDGPTTVIFRDYKCFKTCK